MSKKKPDEKPADEKPVYRPSNPDALAIRWALECSYEPLRREAKKIVAKALDETDGSLYATADRLGIKRKTIRAWIDRNDDLREVRLKAASRRTGGRLPPELEDGARQK